jgi:hypothetical protein
LFFSGKRPLGEGSRQDHRFAQSNPGHPVSVRQRGSPGVYADYSIRESFALFADFDREFIREDFLGRILFFFPLFCSQKFQGLANNVRENIRFAQTFSALGGIPLLTSLFGCFPVEPFLDSDKKTAGVVLRKSVEVQTDYGRVKPTVREMHQLSHGFFVFCRKKSSNVGCLNPSRRQLKMKSIREGNSVSSSRLVLIR